MSLIESLKKVTQQLQTIKQDHVNTEERDNAFERKLDLPIHLLNPGIKLFTEFVELGREALALEINSFKQICREDDVNTEIHIIADLIVDLEDWIYHFFSSFTDHRIEYDEYWYHHEDACTVRSGFQFMLDLFSGIGNEKLDGTFKLLQNDLQPWFDERMELSKKLSNFKNNKPVAEFIPKSHVWWFQ